jgi:hypothetical protein
MPGDSPKQLTSLDPAPPYGVTHGPKTANLGSDAYPVPGGSSKSDWLKDDIKRLDEKKVGVDVFEQKDSSDTQRFEIIEKKVDSLRGCSRHEEFEDMKKDIAGWRNFFRSTVAVGALGGLSVIAGWLWQYYTLTSSVADTSESIGVLKIEVKEIAKEIQNHKELSLETQLEQQKNLEVRFNEMEYRLMLAMSRMSQGQQLNQPSPDAYLRSRRDQLSNSINVGSAAINDDILKKEVKAMTASVPAATDTSSTTRRNP